jgi:hypothetical protein
MTETMPEPLAPRAVPCCPPQGPPARERNGARTQTHRSFQVGAGAKKFHILKDMVMRLHTAKSQII